MRNPRRWVGTISFVAIWLVVWCAPSLRQMLSAQASGAFGLRHEYSWLADFGNREFDFEQLATRYPDDARVQAREVESRVYRSEEPQVDEAIPAGFSQRDTVAAYDRLIQRFPDQAWLLANRLRLTTLWFRDDRLAGDLEDTRPLPRTTPAPEKKPKPTSSPALPASPASSALTYPTFSPLELSQAIAAARKGRRLEPDNCFFDSMLAYFLMSGYRDAKALRVMDEGSRKTRFDDHTLDDVQAAIAVYERVRPLLIEEKISIAASEPLPHLSPLRHLALLLSWKAWKLERKGDHAGALRIRGALMRMSAPITQGRNILMNSFLGNACQAIAWSGNPGRNFKSVRNQMPPVKQDSASWTRAQWRLMARQFALYARAHGRADLANEAVRAGKRTGRLQVAQLAATNIDTLGVTFGIDRNTMLGIYGFWILSRAALVQIVVTIALCAALSVVLFGSRPQPRERRDLLWSVGPGALPSAVFAMCALHWNIGSFENFVLNYPPSVERSAPVVALFSFLLAPLMASVLVPWAATLWRIHGDREVLLKPPPPRYDGESARLMVPHDHLPLIFKTTIQFAVGAMFACWLIALPDWLLGNRSPATLTEAAWFAAAACGLSLICYIGWLVKWRWMAPPLLRPLQHAALRWHRQTLSFTIIIASLFWVALSLFSLSPRRAAQTQFDDYLQHGEIAALHIR